MDGGAFLLSGGVATADPRRNRVRGIPSVQSQISLLVQMLRAKPSIVFNSSTVPYASTRRSAFEMRTPPANPVCPPSPRVVAILISRLLAVHRFHQKLPGTLQREYESPCEGLSAHNAEPGSHRENP